ncbi:oncostatin-M [Dasypus novemcinctus]|uniref:oncostatin-M n=1 Tax=Dasypus novemcinctus TaxID=9361 RepID=UPI00265EF640|nr:oncostatin-M [Dasypus novemcinctus]
MRAQLTRRTLPSLALGLLFLSAAAMGGCTDKYRALLSQLRAQADVLGNSSQLLDHYIHFQGLNVPDLKKHCKERPGAFPSKDVLRGLSRRDFLHTLEASLDRVLHQLATLQQEPLEVKDAEELHGAKRFLRGIKNNIYCMSRLLGAAAEPTRAGPGTPRPPAPSPDAFQRKIEGCKLLQGFHRFMRAVGQVLGEWEARPGRSRRHSPRRAPRRTRARRPPLPERGRRLVPRGLLPR